MLIEELRFKFGASPSVGPLKLNSPTCTVFVGPNNSGKSLVLREIVQGCSDGRNSTNFVLDDIRFKPHGRVP
jgi:predicted ATP-dependent endonuclease of OLD family